MGRCARRPTPIVRHTAEREMIVNLARVHRPARADELQQALDVPAAGDAPWRLTAARMHQAEYAVGDKAVVDEGVLMDAKAGVLALQVARAVVGDTVPQRQILSARRRPNRVSLHETEGLERLRQRCRWKQAPRDRVSPQLVDGQSRQLSVFVASSRNAQHGEQTISNALVSNWPNVFVEAVCLVTPRVPSSPSPWPLSSSPWCPGPLHKPPFSCLIRRTATRVSSCLRT